jgi:predicted dehydrogenase
MKVLFVGLGGIGQRHLRNLVAQRGDSVEILAHRVRGLSRTLTDRLQVDDGVDLQRRYGIRVIPDLDDAVGQADVVFICNPSSLHVPVALAAARAGCSLFVEKPVSASWEGIDELLGLVASRRLVTLVGFQMRFHPLLRRLQALVAEEAVGRVLAVLAQVAEYLPGFHTYEDYRAMYAARRALGGGVILSQTHEFDYLYALLGLPERVFTLGGHLSSLEVDVEDVADVSMEFRRGGRPVPVQLHLDYVQRPAVRTCAVLGDGGKILLDFHAASLRRFDGEGRLAFEETLADFPRNRMFSDEMEHFLACIEGRAAPLVPLAEGVQSLRMALAARESLETGRVVAVAGVEKTP